MSSKTKNAKPKTQKSSAKSTKPKSASHPEAHRYDPQEDSPYEMIKQVQDKVCEILMEMTKQLRKVADVSVIEDAVAGQDMVKILEAVKTPLKLTGDGVGNAESDDLKKKFEIKTKRMKEMQAEVIRLKEQLQHEKYKEKELMKNLEKKDEEIKELSEILKKLQKEKTEKQNIGQQKEDSFELAKQELEKLHLAKQELEKENKRLSEELQTEKDKTRVLEEKLQQQEKDKTNELMKNLEKKDEEIKELSEILKKQQKKKTEKQNIGQQKEDSFELAKQKLEKENKRLSEELQTEKDTTRELNEKLQKQEKDKTNEQHGGKQMEASLQQEKRELEKDNKRLEEELQTEKDKTNELNTKLKSKEEREKELYRELQAEKDKTEKLSTQLKSEKDKKKNYSLKDSTPGNGDVKTKIRKFEEENEHLRPRLSQIAGSKLTDNNPSISDLSDPNRPSSLREKFSALYDNEWTDAMEVLCEHINEKDAIGTLLKIVSAAYAFCEEKSTSFMTENMKTLELLTKPPVKEAQKACKDCRKTVAVHAIELLQQGFCQQHDEHKNKESVVKYKKKCIQVCWFMTVQDPMVVIDSTIPKKLDTDFHKVYTKSGKYVDYLVWPVLYLHKKGDGFGPILDKGVAQGKN